ncbi:MAG: hypothetical protein IPO60_14745 [Flavobacteriales bacterium]|nr:hypothetical protein [Flavobacteriales bacterium]
MAFAQDGFEQTRRAVINGTLSIDLPFFGLAFDVNDLALLSGLGFTLLLLAISFNVYREHHNLRSLLDWVACAAGPNECRALPGRLRIIRRPPTSTC